MKRCVFCFLLLLACTNPSVAQGFYENCCLVYSKEPNNYIKERVVSYWIQETDGGCNLSAVVFKTKKSQTFCAKPKKKWVRKLMKRINSQIKRI